MNWQVISPVKVRRDAMSGLTRRRRPKTLTELAKEAAKLRKQLAAVEQGLGRIQRRLGELDEGLVAEAVQRQTRKLNAALKDRGIRCSGPKVTDLAFEILSRCKKGLPLPQIAKRVLEQKPGVAGANFTQNLGAALANDERFRRVGRGVYAVK